MINLCNLIRCVDQFTDNFSYREVTNPERARIASKIYLIFSIGSATFDEIGSGYEFAKDSAAIMLRMNELAQRAFNLGIPFFLPQNSDARKQWTVSCLSAANAALFVFFPQYASIRCSLSILEAALRTHKIIEKCKQLN